MSGESMTAAQLAAEMDRALAAVELARFRMIQHARAYGDGRVDRDLSRRFSNALARVRYLDGAVALAKVA